MLYLALCLSYIHFIHSTNSLLCARYVQALEIQKRSLPSRVFACRTTVTCLPFLTELSLVGETDIKEKSPVSGARKEENKRKERVRWGWAWPCSVGGSGLPEEVMSELSWREGKSSQTDDEGQNFEGRGNCMCKGSRTGRRFEDLILDSGEDLNHEKF